MKKSQKKIGNHLLPLDLIRVLCTVRASQKWWNKYVDKIDNFAMPNDDQIDYVLTTVV